MATVESNSPPRSWKNPFRKNKERGHQHAISMKGGGIVKKMQGPFRKENNTPKMNGKKSPKSSRFSNSGSNTTDGSYNEHQEEKKEPSPNDWGETPDANGSTKSSRPLSPASSSPEDMIYQKQQLKERDGFCRRVDTYDGSVIVVDQKPTYEIGNYLGGGVAGVVYEGHRLRPLQEYPIRKGLTDEEILQSSQRIDVEESSGFFCSAGDFGRGDNACGRNNGGGKEPIMEDIPLSSPTTLTTNTGNEFMVEEADMAIEATVSQSELPGVMLDAQDAPSRSVHYTKAASKKLRNGSQSLEHGLTEEAVAIKILNPVGYRILQADGLKGTVVVKEGAPMEKDVKKGIKPMQEKHVWWLVNPNSRNLRTLQRYNGKNNESMSVQVDRGSAKKGLRLSLIAAYIDPRKNSLRELTLTRCIEIWGHMPFNTTDVEFEDMMTAIERINAGQPPPAVDAFSEDGTPGRVGTDVTAKSSLGSQSDRPYSPVAFKSVRTGLLRAALTERKTVKCSELNAYIAIPAVPTKYLRWLRQRRAATKEIRNMMSIGRHKNVLHLFEVLEFIQEAKSTMFLILELVKGGELFDLISSSAKNGKSKDPKESERMMRKFFYELSSGIHFCHKNGIAHRDLKPENLLVHTPANAQTMLKIADFGLSAAFGMSQKSASDNDTVLDSLASPMSQASLNDSFISTRPDSVPVSPNPISPNSLKNSYENFLTSTGNALSFLTCGAMETVLCLGNPTVDGPSELRRMTSVVGSPHYVAPEIISQTDDQKGKKKGGSGGSGYDGAKADVWSAGVILYAMLFRSLPFGEDLLRCPRFQSYKKWYDEVRQGSGRRATSQGALNPRITESDEQGQLGPHWFFPATSSKESRDLIVAMLNPKPSDRLSIEQVLGHPWVLPEAS